MHNLLLMTVDHSGEQLLHNDGRVILTEGFDLRDFIKELTSIYVLRDQVEIDLVLVELVELYDIRMIELLQDVNLIDE